MPRFAPRVPFPARRPRTARIALVAGAVVMAACSGGGSAGSKAANKAPAAPPTVPSIEAGVEPWSLPVPISREAVVPAPGGLAVVGGLEKSGTSATGVASLNTSSGAIAVNGSLATGVHDAAAAAIGSSVVVFGGGNPTTTATVQSVPIPGGTASATGQVAGSLPTPRSDLAAVQVASGSTTTTYIVGGYDGTNGQPAVLATTDGHTFRTVAQLQVAVRYPAVAAMDGSIYVFGGQTVGAGSAVTATDDIQKVDLGTQRVSVVGHLPQAEYGAAAFTIGNAVYVAGGQVPGGDTLTSIEAYTPDGRLLPAGLLPQAEAFGGYTTVGSGTSAVGWIVGGEVAAQSGTTQAGEASGTLDTILSLKISSYGGPAGTAAAGAPFSGTLLMADRGNNRLVAITPDRSIIWTYPSSTMPPPPGGFYFPDDAFFIHGGTGIISNQEDNHTIVEIGYPSGKILWQYGHPGVAGAGAGYLNQPDDAYLLKNGTITVADASNNRILFISPSGAVTGQIGNGKDAHVPGVSIAYPNGDTPLADGNLLVSEINGSYIDEYTPSGQMLWSVQMKTVNYPSDPQQLGPDQFLMCDYDPPAEGRILTFDKEGAINWEYDVKSGDGALKKPSLAERLPNGLIMTNDDYQDRIAVIDPATNEIVWQYGLTGVGGTTPGMLSIPDGFDLLEAGGVTPTHPITG